MEDQVMRRSDNTSKGDRQHRERDGPGILRELLYLFIKIVVIALVFMLIFTFIFGIFRYDDASMTPAIKDGDLVVYYRLDKEYVASDTLILEYEGKTQVRRVVAVAGDEVDIADGKLVINGSPQQEIGIYEDTQRFDTGVEFPLKLQNGQVFVLGDSRGTAADSRVYGAVDTEDTLGKVMTVIRRRGI